MPGESREIALMIRYNDIKMQIRVITRYKPATIIIIHRDTKGPGQTSPCFLRRGGSYRFRVSFLFHLGYVRQTNRAFYVIRISQVILKIISDFTLNIQFSGHFYPERISSFFKFA